VDSPDQDIELETISLQLINRVAYAASSQATSRQLRDVTGLDLPPSSIRLLLLLAGRPPVVTSELAIELTIDLAQASRQASQLERLGHLERTADQADRRRTLVTLTPATAKLFDQWLLAWTNDYLAPVTRWPRRDVADLTHWFALVRDRLGEALPGRPGPRSSERWQALVEPDQHHPVVSRFLSTVIGLVSWSGQSGGFNELLESIGAPIRQHAYFTLRIVARHGPLPISEVAEWLDIDPSQASKRLRQLTDLRLVDRAVDGFDRRTNLVRVSRKGSALLAKVREAQLATFRQTIGEISAKDREDWTTLMRRYINEMIPERDSRMSDRGA
jgi:DNA-binding MarR family transcriptional regulator